MHIAKKKVKLLLGSLKGETSPFFIIKTHVYTPAVIHSGDSACVIPPVSIPADNLATIKEYTKKIAESLHVCGMMNMQYAIENGKVYVIEANPCESLESLGLKDKKIPYYGAKEGRTLSHASRVYGVNSQI